MRETVYMLQTFEVLGLRTFRFDRPVIYGALRDAMAVVEETRGKAGLMITAISGDPRLLIFDQPIIVHTMGMIPFGLLPKRALPVSDAEAERVYRRRIAQATLEPNAQLALSR